MSYYKQKLAKKIKGLDRTEIVNASRRASRGRLPIDFLDEGLVSYKKRTKIQTHLIPGGWKHVLAIAIIYAVAINAIRVCYYYAFGKPQILVSGESLPSDFQ